MSLYPNVLQALSTVVGVFFIAHAWLAFSNPVSSALETLFGVAMIYFGPPVLLGFVLLALVLNFLVLREAKKDPPGQIGPNNQKKP